LKSEFLLEVGYSSAFLTKLLQEDQMRTIVTTLMLGILASGWAIGVKHDYSYPEAD
jgi:hypothetical protein